MAIKNYLIKHSVHYYYLLITIIVTGFIYNPSNFALAQKLDNNLINPNLYLAYEASTRAGNDLADKLSASIDNHNQQYHHRQGYVTNFQQINFSNQEAIAKGFDPKSHELYAQSEQADEKTSPDSDPFLIDLEKNNTENEFEISGIDKETGQYKGFFLGARIGLPYLLGAEFGYDFGHWGRVRSMLDIFGLAFSPGVIPGISAKFGAKVEYLTFGIYGDIYPTKITGFRLTAGFGYNGIKLALGYNLKVFNSKNELLKLEYASKMFFAFGLGYDSNRSLKDRQGFYYSFDLLIYYLGSIKLNVLDSAEISDALSQPFRDYLDKVPVSLTLGFSLGYRF